MDPLITIGMPVRNAGDQIREALDTLLAQTAENFRLIISDNCSTDHTVSICEEYAAKDARVRVVRQPENLGICGNFRFVLQEAETPYFMWACHDDKWAPNFIEANLANLAAHPYAVASVSRVILLFPNGERVLARGTSPLTGAPQERVRRFLSHPSEASRFYSVFRTQELKESFPEGIDVIGYDYVVLALNLLRGSHLEVPEYLMEREAHDYLYYQKHFVAKQPRLVDRWFPAHPIVRTIREKIDMPVGGGLRRALFMLQLRQSLQYAAFRFPTLRRMLDAAGISKRSERIPDWPGFERG